MGNILSESVAKFEKQLKMKNIDDLIKMAPKPELKNIPKPITDEHRLLPLLPEEVQIGNIEEIDPWNKVVELLNKCSSAILRKNLDFGEIYYEQIKPFYDKLDMNDKKIVFFKIRELQERIFELRMKRVRKLLRAIY